MMTVDQHTRELLERAKGKTRPIADTHIHLYQPSRSGVAWPSAASTVIYKDFLPDAYMAIATPLGILGSGIVEASPWNSDTRWVLGQVGRTPATRDFFPWYVAELDIGSADFIRNLDAYLTVDARTNPDADKVVGLRVFLWSASIDVADPIQQANLGEVQRRGLTLDIISRGSGASEKNPKAAVIALARAYPGIRIIIDHLAGARIASAMPPSTWMADIAALAAQPNVYIKMSAFFDAAHAGGNESRRWTAPKDMASYKSIFDALWAAFGEDRLIWGSNYPVSELGEPEGVPPGTSIRDQIAIMESYLASKTSAQRDKVMFDNAILFYRRIPTGGVATPDAKTLALLARKTGKTRPIMDTHIHVYQPSRPGVVWPDRANATLYQDYLPATCAAAVNSKAPCGQTYAEAIKGLGVLATTVVGASPRINDGTGNYDTDWALSQVQGNDLFFNYVVGMDIGSRDFIKNLERNTAGMTASGVDRAKMISGLRVYLGGPTIDLNDPVQTANLAEVQRRGMTLDIISRGWPPREMNPKAQVVALARAFPKIRIVIDHMAGAKLDTARPLETWMADIHSLAAQPNIYIKWSAFFDAANATGDESRPWTAPRDAAAYTKVFEALWAAFGEDRLIWGSNWPVVRLAGSLAEEVKIAEDYLATKSPAARDKVMYENAILFYRRIPPP